MTKRFNTPEDFNEEYFRTLNYVDYLNRRDRYIHTGREIADLLIKLKLLWTEDSRILDFGCAVGFLMEGLVSAGCSMVTGYDISEWALQQAAQRGLFVINDLRNVQCIDIMLVLDVMEHMTDEEIIRDVQKVNPNVMVVRIPNSTDGKTFHLEVSQMDPTHINCKTKQQWVDFLENLGYFSIRLNLYSIYDSDGVFAAILIKK